MIVTVEIYLEFSSILCIFHPSLNANVCVNEIVSKLIL